MGSVTSDFDTYTLEYIGGDSLQSGTAGAMINCYKNNELVGLIQFFKDNVIIPANQVINGQIQLHYEMNRFNDVITTLRYEKPLFLLVNTDNGFGYIGTGQTEPVGEQEGVPRTILRKY